MVEDADRGVLVGATVLAPYGGEVVGLLVTAVHGEVPVARLRTMHYAYPTFHRTDRGGAQATRVMMGVGGGTEPTTRHHV